MNQRKGVVQVASRGSAISRALSQRVRFPIVPCPECQKGDSMPCLVHERELHLHDQAMVWVCTVLLTYNRVGLFAHECVCCRIHFRWRVIYVFKSWIDASQWILLSIME